MAEQEGKTIHSVAKAIRLLDLLTAAGQPASLTELYQKTGWPKSTIHGLLSTMRESGLIEQTPNGRYWLGIRLFEYGCAVSNSWDIGAIARPHMQNICTELGESVFLSVFDRAAVVTLAEEESRASLRVVSEVGARLPVHCTSQGKLILANSSPAECRRILTHTELKAYTPHTLTTPEQFAPELTRIREQGYAVENGEYKIGLRSVSAPIHDVTGEVRYAIGCVGMFRQIQSDEFLHAIRLVCAAASSFSVPGSFPPKKMEQSMLTTIVSALSLYRALSWLCACKTRQQEISLERIVATSFSSRGICPIFAASSMRQRT